MCLLLDQGSSSFGPSVKLGSCLSMDSRRHENGQSWHDGCRECYCHDGREMCALISCPVPNCDNPSIRSSQCCPSCPGLNTHLLSLYYQIIRACIIYLVWCWRFVLAITFKWSNCLKNSNKTQWQPTESHSRLRSVWVKIISNNSAINCGSFVRLLRAWFKQNIQSYIKPQILKVTKNLQFKYVLIDC